MKILIIEDEKSLRENLKKLLENDKFTVQTAENGTIGLDLVFEEEFDLIILDIGLPDTNGLEICKTIREEKIKTPIIFLTARATLKDKIAGFDQGADDYISKPFEYEELLARIYAVAKRNRIDSSKFGNLQINFDEKNVVFNNKEINLSNKEFMLLELFITNKSLVLSKQRILDYVWPNEEVSENIVDVYIGYLRNKIDKNLISSKKGIGYKINEI